MTLLLDGREVDATGTLLEVVRREGIPLPSLCKDDNLPVLAACRTCLVEADGRIVAACATPAGAVREVSTTSDRVTRIRRGVLALTAAMVDPDAGAPGGPHSDEFAVARDTARVQPGGPAPEHRRHVDTSSPFFSFHEDACILCGRCIAACNDLQHIGAIGMAGHGRDGRVTPGAGVTFAESICTACGSCVAACPTTALRPKGGLP